MSTLLNERPAAPGHSYDRRDPHHPLRRTKDYRPDGSRTRTWSSPERSYRLSFRRRPILTLASTVLALVVPTTLTYAATSPGPSGQNTISLSGPKSPVMPVGVVVTVGQAGFALTQTTIAVGQGITFYNTDSTTHGAQVTPAESTKCTSTPLVIWAGEYQSCTFASEGTYSIVDPTSRGVPSMTVTVLRDSGVLASVDLFVDKSSVRRGESVTLMGAVNVVQPGVQIDLIAQEKANGPYRKVAETRTAPTGTFSFLIQPAAATTTYFVNALSAGRFAMSTRVAVTSLNTNRAPGGSSAATR